ncbi:GNAT family N-acetyltransferase [Rubripirellula reticaptiva]|uniref:GNAT family N-acetyltransferase n=1 Tax=Rubripirellula reticaptiva TaxID=2528013 RepID=UPI0011B67C9C|nr:GNAT family N-acetyltransferase [Rubripirellula reticaptiva]
MTPFFSLEFFDAVHASRGDVWVAVISARDEVVAFLPFHRIGKVAWPAGRYFNDAHNLVMRPGTMVDWPWLLKQCGVKAYDFHALVGEQSHLPSSSFQGTTESFCALIGNDSKAFLDQLEKDHRTIRRQEQKSRKMSREIGPLSVEVDCRDPLLLDQAIQWKREQYRRTNILDLFTPDWTREMLRHLHASQSSGMRGLLSVLRAGDTVVAAHVGMIENDLLHYWFPTYDIQYSRYSPGTALFKEIVRSADQHGIRCIDMGYGEQPYKRKQTDTITTVRHGCVSGSVIYRNVRALRIAATAAVKQMPMKAALKHMLRKVNPDAGISKIG